MDFQKVILLSGANVKSDVVNFVVLKCHRLNFITFGMVFWYCFRVVDELGMFIELEWGKQLWTVTLHPRLPSNNFIRNSDLLTIMRDEARSEYKSILLLSPIDQTISWIRKLRLLDSKKTRKKSTVKTTETNLWFMANIEHR